MNEIKNNINFEKEKTIFKNRSILNIESILRTSFASWHPSQNEKPFIAVNVKESWFDSPINLTNKKNTKEIHFKIALTNVFFVLGIVCLNKL